ncbi:MAG: cytochrome c3 family protein, partial [Bacillota bacterium]
MKLPGFRHRTVRQISPEIVPPATKGKLKTLIIVLGALLILLALNVGVLTATNTPRFCASCHEMAPEYYTWKGSAHSNTSCITCHVQPGAKNLVKHKLTSLTQVYYHFTGTYVMPIEIKDPIPNSRCEQCHNMIKWVVKPSEDIKIPHAKHLAHKVKCVDCHAGVVHGNIEEKGFTAMTVYDKWNDAVGQAYVSSPVSVHFTRT